MQQIEQLLAQLEANMEAVVAQNSEVGIALWQEFIKKHPADISFVIENIDTANQAALFKQLPHDLFGKVFENLSCPVQAYILSTLDTELAARTLSSMSSDELTSLFDHLSDKSLQHYLKLLQKQQRQHIISSFNFAPKSAGKIMDSDVFTLQDNFTVQKTISIFQQLGTKKEFLPRIYVTNGEHNLIGYIELDDLLVNQPNALLSSIVQENELVADVHDDQQVVANQMHHYGLLVVPVVDEKNHFLGAITADDIFDVIEEEASEDVYKMSGLSPFDHSYFHTSFWRLVRQRSTWLVGLLLLQSISSIIMVHYTGLIEKNIILSMFMMMLIGTGGNAGNQSATLVIRGLATGEVGKKNRWKVLLREFFVAVALAIPLVIVCVSRVYMSYPNVLSAVAIGLSLFCIVILSIMLGTLIPLVLDRFKIDPAHSAAPFLATVMDILGVLICCFIASRILP